MTNETKAFDIILYGATSFVGQIMTEYLATHYSLSSREDDSREQVKWAIAARSDSKLLALKARLNIQDVTHFVVSADDESALTDMANETQVVVSTVGPYALYGETLVKVCVETATDYCDLTGEPQWIKLMLEKYEEQAKKSGARIIHCSGFDSIPSDLGVYACQQHAMAISNKPANHIKMRVRKIKGGASGGTIASMLNVLKEAKNDPDLRKALVNPYVLCPSSAGFKVRQKNHKSAEFDSQLGIWSMPFIMAAINERIVHRSNALLDNQYGTSFRYDEAMTAKTGFQAWTFTMGLGSFMIAASFDPLQKLLANTVLPKPGEGPSLKEQEEGMFDMRFYATTENGRNIITQVTGDRDPGYGSTAKMLAQAAICLAKDIPNLAGGFWTPASALNTHLIKRLQDHAGVVIQQIGD